MNTLKLNINIAILFFSLSYRFVSMDVIISNTKNVNTILIAIKFIQISPLVLCTSLAQVRGAFRGLLSTQLEPVERFGTFFCWCSVRQRTEGRS